MFGSHWLSDQQITLAYSLIRVPLVSSWLMRRITCARNPRYAVHLATERVNAFETGRVRV
jgi:hypothetical protein